MKLEHQGEWVYTAVDKLRDLWVAAVIFMALGLGGLGKALSWWGDPATSSVVDQSIAAAFCFAIAVALLTFRRGLRLDLVGGSATRWSSMLAIPVCSTMDLDLVTGVRFQSKLATGYRATATTYQVHRLSPTSEPLKIAQVAGPLIGRSLAADLAEVLDIPLEDNE